MQTVYRQDSAQGAPDIDLEPAARTIPANLEAERAVLSSCLLDPDAYAKASALLKSTDFYRERNAWIFAAMTALHERRDPVDYVLLMEELERAGRFFWTLFRVACWPLRQIVSLSPPLPTPLPAHLPAP